MTHHPPHAITPLESLEQLEAAIARSAETPVLLFKHSTTCGLSAMAATEVADLLNGAAIDADIFVVDVRGQRPVSNAIAERLKVRHESPQVLLVQNGVVRWHRSHASVTAAAIASALQHARPTGDEGLSFRHAFSDDAQD